MKKDKKNQKPTAKSLVKQPKPISLKEPAQKIDLAKVVGGWSQQAGMNHNESFIVL